MRYILKQYINNTFERKRSQQIKSVYLSRGMLEREAVGARGGCRYVTHPRVAATRHALSSRREIVDVTGRRWSWRLNHVYPGTKLSSLLFLVATLDCLLAAHVSVRVFCACWDVRTCLSAPRNQDQGECSTLVCVVAPCQ